MPDESSKPPVPESTDASGAGAADASGPVPLSDDDRTSERGDRGISDFVRRAVSAGVGAATRSKDDILRVAATEVRSWLEHMNMNEEIAKVLSKMVIEVKTEIRFRPSISEDGKADGKLVPEATNDIKLKSPR
jgi:hypothetical protein